MESSTLISVIVPVYNVEKYLGKCVDSIINQTYKNLEIILVDDGSKDNSGTICDEYSKKDKRVKVIHKENGGAAAARNTGLDICKGEYISFVDSDDWIDESLYKDCISQMDHDVDMILFGLKNVAEDGMTNESIIRPAMNKIYISDSDCQKILDVARNSLLGYPWNKLWKRGIIGESRFLDVGLREDLCFVFEVINKVQYIQCLNVYGYNYVRRDSSLLHSSNINNITDLLTIDDVFQKGIKVLNKKNNLILYNIVAQVACTDVVVKDVIRNNSISKKEKIILIKKVSKNRPMVHRLKLKYSANKLSAIIIVCLKIKQSEMLTNFLMKYL